MQGSPISHSIFTSCVALTDTVEKYDNLNAVENISESPAFMICSCGNGCRRFVAAFDELVYDEQILECIGSFVKNSPK